MSTKHPEPSLAKRKKIVPKSARFTGGAPLDTEKPPMFISQQLRKAAQAIIKDYSKIHIMARRHLISNGN